MVEIYIWILLIFLIIWLTTFLIITICVFSTKKDFLCGAMIITSNSYLIGHAHVSVIESQIVSISHFLWYIKVFHWVNVPKFKKVVHFFQWIH